MEQFQPGPELDYMDVFNVIQPGLKRLHVRIFIPGWVSARAEISARVAQTGLKLLSYNRVLCFIRILQQDRADVSAHGFSPG